MNTHNATRTRLFVGLETSKNLEIHPEEVISFIRDRVDAGTFYESKGLWKGNLENSIVFECMNIEENMTEEPNTGDGLTVEQLQQELAEEFEQDSVMVEQAEVEVSF